MALPYIYPRAMMSLMNGEINVLTHTLKATLHTASYTPDLDAHRYQSSLAGELATGSGYTAGGLTLTGKTLNYDASTDTAWLDCDDLIWAEPTTLSARYCVISDTNSGAAATNPLLALIDFEAVKSSDNSVFKIGIAATGLVRLSAN